MDSFTLTCEGRLDAFNSGNNDLCIAFGARGESEFYYAHLGESADGAHLQVHLVNNADRKPITSKRAQTLPWQPEHWHSLKLVRNGSSGSIKVWFDDQLVLEAADTTFGKGRIGLGSFDDLGAFRKVVITPALAPVAEAAPLQLELVAGGGTAVENAPAKQCKASQPFGIAFDAQDNMFICEETHRLLRVDAKTGVLTVVSSAKPKGAAPGDNGPAKDASFSAPHNLVADAEGNLFVADTYHYAVRRVDAKTGIVTRFAGNDSKELSGDGGPATQAGSMESPACALATISPSSTSAVSASHSRRGREDRPHRHVPGIGGSRAMAVDSKGNLFIAAGRGLRMLGVDGKAVALQDPAATPPLNGVKHLWADHDDNILIADASNHLIRKFIVLEGKLVTLAGVGTKGSNGVPGPALDAQLGEPHGVVTHPRSGDIYVADSRNDRVLRIKAGSSQSRKPSSAP